MAGGNIVPASGGDGDSGKITRYVAVTCIVGAMGGLIFGYDIGISGGVTSMPPFLERFFMSVYKKQALNNSSNQYCKFDSWLLTLFTSSLYIAALFASWVASFITKQHGRKTTMFLGGFFFFIGALLNAGAVHISMLILGRILLGFGVGFANQSVPIYLSEVAPPKHRGRFNVMFQLAITIGILIANVVNFLTNKISGGWGWRVSLGGAAVPALFILFSCMFLSDSPSSLIDRGRKEEAKQLLKKIRGVVVNPKSNELESIKRIFGVNNVEAGELLKRIKGVDNVEVKEFLKNMKGVNMAEAEKLLKNIIEEKNFEAEFDHLLMASEASMKVESPWSNLFFNQKYRPQLILSTLIPSFQQLTGINVVMFYAPVLLQTLGFGSNASLASAAITGAVNVLATFISVYGTDKYGRRTLFFWGGSFMCIFQAALAALIGIKFGTAGSAIALSRGYTGFVVVCICVFVASFAYSWGPLGWLVPSEISPLEVRSAAQCVTVPMNMVFTFLIAQIFLKMLCWMKFGLFIFFAAFVVIMTFFVYFFVPETKNIPIEEMSRVWGEHWYWKKYVDSDGKSKEIV